MWALRGLVTYRKVDVLVAVLEVDGSRSIKIKKGPETGKTVSVVTATLGADDGIICRLTAWRDVADAWSGVAAATAVKEGDIVSIKSESIPPYLEKLTFIASCSRRPCNLEAKQRSFSDGVNQAKVKS